MGEEDEVVGHKRYANLARSPNKPYSSGNIVFGYQASQVLAMALLDEVTKRGVLRSNISSNGHLLLLNGPKDGL